MNKEDGLARAIRGGVLGTINKAEQRVVERQLQVPPSLSIRLGFPMRVIITGDRAIAPQKG